MTTYYGVWSSKERKWWYTDWTLFSTPSLGVAKAQAVIVNRQSPDLAPWEARAIGDDGLPVSGLVMADAETKAETECTPCAMCGQPATEWVDVHVRGWMCDDHRVVKLGGFSEERAGQFQFCKRLGYWVREAMR